MKILRTFDLLKLLSEKYSCANALADKAEGSWRQISTSDYINNVNYLSYALLDAGIKKDDKIATVFSNNRIEWNYIDMAAAQIGAIHVPVYPTISDEDHKYILEHSDSVILFVSDATIYLKLKGIADKIPAIRAVYSASNSSEIDSVAALIERGKKLEVKYKEKLEEIKTNIGPDNLLTIIYTSGTTGTPKGVMLTHRNLVSNFIETSYIQPMVFGHKALSFLPLCHVYERMMNYHFQYKGISIYYAESMSTILDNLKEIQPDGFNCVPRLLEKVYLGIIAKGKDLDGMKKKIFFNALSHAEKFKLKKRSFLYELQRKLYDKLVFSKWRAAIGGNVKIIVSGGSSLQPRLSKIFWAAGIPVLEGYGLTETAPVIAVSHYNENDIKFGTVGPILKGVDVKFDEEGEILCKGPNVMLGYYKDEEYTKKVIDEEGWFHTGDIGILEDNRFLKITDRKKEIFKLSGGKYIAPQIIENKFKASPLIDNIMIIGENEKFASALISPNFTYLHFYASKHKIHFRDNQELIQNPKIVKRIQKEIDSVNSTLGQFEHIKRFRLVKEEWTTQTGELSPTLKLKRKNIAAKYNKVINEIYRKIES